MNVYIVLSNGKVDSVFDNLEAATNHRHNLMKLWALTDILTFEVHSI